MCVACLSISFLLVFYFWGEKPLLTTLVEQNPEDMGDLYLDVAEAFLDVGEYNSALPLLSALVCSERYNLAVVWLRHAGKQYCNVVNTSD